MTGPSATDPRIDVAGRILREAGDASTWPQTQEARWALHQAREFLIAALSEYQDVLQDTGSWSSQEQDAALEEAAVTAYDAAVALVRQRDERGNTAAARRAAA